MDAPRPPPPSQNHVQMQRLMMFPHAPEGYEQVRSVSKEAFWGKQGGSVHVRTAPREPGERADWGSLWLRGSHVRSPAGFRLPASTEVGILPSSLLGCGADGKGGG